VPGSRGSRFGTKMSGMQLRSKVAATVVVMLALLVPAGTAHADPVRTATVWSADSTVYPAIDGYVDGTVISGAVTSSAGVERIRGSVVLTTGNRIAKVWMLGTTGAFAFPWNGRIGGSVVAGTYTVTVRADGMAPVTSSLKVSAKKITRVSATRSASLDGGLGFNCIDNLGLEFTDPGYTSHLLAICPMNLGYLPTYDSAKASGRLYVAHLVSLPSAIRHSLGPVTARVTGSFTQTGAGSNKMWVCGTDSEDCQPGTVRTWSGPATVTASARLDDPLSVQDLTFWIRLDHGHQLSVVGERYSITYTYYALR